MEELSEVERVYRLLIAFHPKALINLDSTAGLLAFHIADAFPSVPNDWDKTVAFVASNKKWITVAGTAPESPTQVIRTASPAFPFNLLMIVSAEEPLIRHKHKTGIDQKQCIYFSKR